MRLEGHSVCRLFLSRAGRLCLWLFFLGAPFSPNKKKSQKQNSASAHGGLSVCRLFVLRGSVCIASHRSKRQKAFLFLAAGFLLLLRLACLPQEKKTKSLFVFGGWLFAFSLPPAGVLRVFTHTYIYIYLKRPSVASACKHAHTYIPEAPAGRCPKKIKKSKKNPKKNDRRDTLFLDIPWWCQVFCISLAAVSQANHSWLFYNLWQKHV